MNRQVLSVFHRNKPHSDGTALTSVITDVVIKYTKTVSDYTHSYVTQYRLPEPTTSAGMIALESVTEANILTCVAALSNNKKSESLIEDSCNRAIDDHLYASTEKVYNT